MLEALLAYALIGVVVIALNLRGVMVLINTGNMTFSGISTRRDWFNIGYPLFVNAVGQGCVWPLMLPVFVTQAREMMKHGPPTIRFTQEEPIEMPLEEEFQAQSQRAFGAVVPALNEALKGEDIHALCAAQTLMALAWQQVECEFKEQRRSRGHAVDYFVNNARKLSEEAPL